QGDGGVGAGPIEEGYTYIDEAHFFFSSRRRHTRSKRDWSSDVCSSDLWSCKLLVHFASEVQGFGERPAPRPGLDGQAGGGQRMAEAAGRRRAGDDDGGVRNHALVVLA